MKHERLNKQVFSHLIKGILTPMVTPGGQSLYGFKALMLVLCTTAHESHFGELGRRQIHGPARGLCGCEPDTFKWLRDKYSPWWRHLQAFSFQDLEHRDDVAVIFCRLRYLAVPEPIPEWKHGEGLPDYARYWGKYYQTRDDPVKEREFIEDSVRYVIEG